MAPLCLTQYCAVSGRDDHCDVALACQYRLVGCALQCIDTCIHGRLLVEGCNGEARAEVTAVAHPAGRTDQRSLP